MPNNTSDRDNEQQAPKSSIAATAATADEVAQ